MKTVMLSLLVFLASIAFGATGFWCGNLGVMKLAFMSNLVACALFGLSIQIFLDGRKAAKS